MFNIVAFEDHKFSTTLYLQLTSSCGLIKSLKSFVTINYLRDIHLIERLRTVAGASMELCNITAKEK